MNALFSYDDPQELAETKNRIEMCISDIENWMAVNKLGLNKGKSELLLLNSSFRRCLRLDSLTLGYDTVYTFDYARNIGVVCDTTMTLQNHVNALVKFSFFHLRNIAKVRKYLSSEISRILVQSFVCSKSDNCNALFYGHPKYLIQKATERAKRWCSGHCESW